MVDVHTAKVRSYNMAQIRRANTQPELIVRALAHRLGYRFRLHVSGLPGTPDLVFPRRRKIIFVHGCFFHMHHCRFGNVTPKTNAEFWRTKRESNVARDTKNARILRASGWKVLTIWECWTKSRNVIRLSNKLESFLG